MYKLSYSRLDADPKLLFYGLAAKCKDAYKLQGDSRLDADPKLNQLLTCPVVLQVVLSVNGMDVVFGEFDGGDAHHIHGPVASLTDVPLALVKVEHRRNIGRVWN